MDNPFRRGKPAQHHRPLVASAARLKIGDRHEAERLKRHRQGWQHEALAYADAIGEIRYPLHFMAAQTTRIRVYPAILVDPDQPPLPLHEAADLPDANIPDDLIAAAQLDLDTLGMGQIGLRPILSGTYLNSKTTGEMWLVGWTDSDGDEHWEIRSIDEVVIDDQARVWIRDEPSGATGAASEILRPFPDDGYITRIWRPHYRWRALADSPMKSILDSSEELLLASRVVRSLLRNRIAGNGLAVLAQELSLPGVDPGDDDPEADPLFEALTTAMMTAISDEGDASAAVPVFMRAPAAMIETAFKHFTLDRPLDEVAMKLRPELIGRIATGMDWPRELVTGISDMNHWSAWAVDESTFKGHIEPDVIVQCDELTVAYARPMLQARTVLGGEPQFDPQLIKRLVYWYDPTELVTKPDMSDNAQAAVSAGAAGRASLRKHLGLSDDDRPDQLDEILYALPHLRGVDPHIAIPILAKVAPDITWPDPATIGTTDAIAITPPEKQDPPADELQPGAPPEPQSHPVEDATPSAPLQDRQAEPIAAAALIAAGVDYARLSARLAALDEELRAKLLTACDAAVRRVLERAGARLRSKAAKDPALRAQVASVTNPLLAAALGPDGVDRLGMAADDLTAEDWADLHRQWETWVKRAQAQARRIAARIADVPNDDPSMMTLEESHAQGLDAGWKVLALNLTKIVKDLLFNPHPDAPEQGEYLAEIVIPVDLVRTAVAVAGDRPGLPGDGLPAGTWGIGSGRAVQNFLDTNSMEIESYQWQHGGSDRPLPAHEDLDGYTFKGWDDPGLVNDDSFPEVDVLAPGDHSGCGCQALVNWKAKAAEQAIAASTSTRANGAPDTP